MDEANRRTAAVSDTLEPSGSSQTQIWPRSGAFGASAMLSPCDRLLWCEWYDMQEIPKPLLAPRRRHCFSALRSAVVYELYDMKE